MIVEVNYNLLKEIAHLLEEVLLQSGFLLTILWTCITSNCFSMFSSVQSLSCVRLFATPWTVARQASLSIINSQSLFKLMSIQSEMPSNYLILCHPHLLSPSIFPSIRVFSNESVLPIRWPKYWSFSFSISPSNDCSVLISCRMGWFDLLVVQGLYRWQMNIWKDVQHHSLLEKCKSKPQWGIISLQSVCEVSEVKSLSRVPLFATMWTVAYQSSPSMGFSKEYWSGLPFPSPILLLGMQTGTATMVNSVEIP